MPLAIDLIRIHWTIFYHFTGMFKTDDRSCYENSKIALEFNISRAAVAQIF